jgi:PAS domain S-box-containing protein
MNRKPTATGKTSVKKVTKRTTAKATTSSVASKDLSLFSGHAAAQYDLDGNLTAATEDYLKLFDLSKVQAKGMSFDDLSNKDADDFSFSEVLQSEAAQLSKTIQRRTAKGSALWVRSKFLWSKNAKGQRTSVIEITDDVSQEVERSLDQAGQIKAIQNSQAVIEFDLDGKILAANEIFLKTVGYDLSDIVGKHHRIFVDPQEANSKEYVAFWDALRRGECQKGEFRRKSKADMDIWIQAYYTPILDAAGKPYKIIKFISDASAESTSQNELTKNMLTNMAASITFADANNIISYVNPSAENLLRKVEQFLPVRANQILGQSIDVFHKNPHHQRQLVANKQNFPFKGTIQIGPEYFVLNASRIVDDKGQFLGTLVSWDHVTERVVSEKQILDNNERERRQTEELRQKVAIVLENVNAIAEGNFDSIVPDLGTDAVGQVGTALNQAIVAINDAMKEVRQVSGTVSSAAEQLTSASREISSGAQTQASSLEETASSLEEITSTVKQNTDNAQQARQLAVGSRDVAEKGGEVVGEAVKAMCEINQSSKKIADIITTIDEIAFQTNLLALNAAVEAARAGEQGRGFAVVASEVRNLAQRSASAAKEIKNLIQDSVRKVEVGTDLVNRSGSSLNDIVNSVKRVTDIVAEIAAASKEQLTGIEQVNKAVSQMDRITQSNAAQTEEMSGTADSLLSHARQLGDLVLRFKLSGGQSESHSRQSYSPQHEQRKPANVGHASPSQASSNPGSGGRCPINFDHQQPMTGSTVLEF